MRRPALCRQSGSELAKPTGRRRGALRDLRRPHPAGRHGSPVGIPPSPQAPAGRPGRRVDMVGPQVPGLVDRHPVCGGIAFVRARRGPRLRQRRRGPLGRGDLLYRLAVLHRSRVPDLPGSRGRRAASARGQPPALLRLPAPQDRLVGHGRATSRDPLLQRQYRQCGAGGPHRQSREPACMAPRCRRLGLLPGRQRAGLVRGLSRLDRWRPRSWSWWITLLNLAGSVAFGVSAVAGYISPATGQLHNAERSNLGTLIGAVCFLPGHCCSCPSAPRKPAPW